MRVLVLKVADAIAELDEFNPREKRLIIDAALQPVSLLTPFVYLAGVFFCLAMGVVGAAVAMELVAQNVSPAFDFVPRVLICLAGVFVPVVTFCYFRDWWVRLHVRRWIAMRKREAMSAVPTIRPRAASPKLCIQCDYDLQGTPCVNRKVLCPECGFVTDMAMWDRFTHQTDGRVRNAAAWPEVEICRAQHAFTDLTYVECCDLIEMLECTQSVTLQRARVKQRTVQGCAITILSISCLYAAVSPYPDVLISLNLFVGVPLVIWICARAQYWRLGWLREALVAHLSRPRCYLCGLDQDSHPSPSPSVSRYTCAACHAARTAMTIAEDN